MKIDPLIKTGLKDLLDMLRNFLEMGKVVKALSNVKKKKNASTQSVEDLSYSPARFPPYQSNNPGAQAST